MAGPTSDVQPKPPSRPPRERDRPPRRKRVAGPETHRHGLADDIESPWQNGIRVRFFFLMSSSVYSREFEADSSASLRALSIRGGGECDKGCY